MPPSFLLVALIVVAGLASPLVICAVLLAAVRPATRHVGQHLRRWGIRAAVAAMVANFILSLVLREPPTLGGTALGAGAAFTFGAGAALFARWWREEGINRSAA